MDENMIPEQEDSWLDEVLGPEASGAELGPDESALFNEYLTDPGAAAADLPEVFEEMPEIPEEILPIIEEIPEIPGETPDDLLDEILLEEIQHDNAEAAADLSSTQMLMNAVDALIAGVGGQHDDAVALKAHAVFRRRLLGKRVALPHVVHNTILRRGFSLQTRLRPLDEGKVAQHKVIHALQWGALGRADVHAAIALDAQVEVLYAFIGQLVLHGHAVCRNASHSVSASVLITKRFFSHSMSPSFFSLPISAERPLRSTCR